MTRLWCWLRTNGWSRWGFALALAWLLYVVLNGIFSIWHFDHLGRYAPPNLAEWQRLTRVASGASRPSVPEAEPADGPKADAAGNRLMKGMAVFRGRASRLVDGDKNAARLRLSGAEMDEALRVYEADIDGAENRPDAFSPWAKIAATQVELLRLRHFYLPATAIARLRAIRDSVGDPERTLDEASRVLSEKEQRVASPIFQGERDFWGVDPLELSPTELKSFAARVAAQAARAREELARIAGRGLPAPDENWPGEAAFRTDRYAIVPFDANPHLALFPPRGRRPVDSSLTVVWFPPVGAPETPAPDPAKKAAIVPGKPPAFDRAAGAVFCLELSHSGSWWAGDSWEARYLLLEAKRPGYPIVSPRAPVVVAIERRSGWSGVRPTAVKVTEEQLAVRFFPQLGELESGARFPGTFQPKSDPEKAPFVAFVQRALVVALGGSEPASVAGSTPEQQYSPVPEPASDWVVWPRRFNGGTWWGLIQFAIAVMTVRFFLDWFPLLRATPATDAASREVLRRRMHTLSAVVALLPLVGFLGTVAGLSNSLIVSTGVSSDSATERQASLQAMQIALGTAFDKAILAFSAVIVCSGARQWLVWRLRL